jgi:hypothetical protein
MWNPFKSKWKALLLLEQKAHAATQAELKKNLARIELLRKIK